MINILFNENIQDYLGKPFFDTNWLIKNMFGDKSKFRKEKIKSIFKL